MSNKEEAERYIASLMFPILGDWDKCIEWSTSRLTALGGQTPINYLEAGKLKQLKALVSKLRGSAGVGFEFTDDGA